MLPIMGTCELCGSEKVSTRRASATGIKLEACNRCIDKMHLKIIENPIQHKQTKKGEETETAMLGSKRDRRNC